MQNNPYDDLLKNLALLLEQISHFEEPGFEESKEKRAPHIIGCAIFTGHGVFNSGKSAEAPMEQSLQIPYEMMSDSSRIYITAPLPVTNSEHPDVSVTPQQVTITIGQSVANVDLAWTADVAASSYEIKNGVIDVIVVRSDEKSETIMTPDEQSGSY